MQRIDVYQKNRDDWYTCVSLVNRIHIIWPKCTKNKGSEIQWCSIKLMIIWNVLLILIFIHQVQFQYSLSVTHITKFTFMSGEHFQENVYIYVTHSMYSQVIVYKLLSFILLKINYAKFNNWTSLNIDGLV